MALNIPTIISRLLVRSYSSLIKPKRNVWLADNIVTSPYQKIQIPNATVIEHIWRNLEKWSDKTAVICGVTNRSYTYHQLYKRSRNFAVRLHTHYDFRGGDVACIMMPNSPEYCVAVLGILEAGAVATTMNPIYTSHEMHKQLILSNPKVIIGSTSTVKVIKGALELAKKDIPIILVKQLNDDTIPPGIASFEELMQGDVEYSILNNIKSGPDDVVLLPYSSGTTGLPKGVELTNRCLVSNLAQCDDDGVKMTKETTRSYQDVVLCVLPFYHIYGLMLLMLHKLSVGAKLVTLPKFHPTSYLNSLKHFKVSLLCAVPPMISFPHTTKEHLQYVNRVTCGAAPMPMNDIHRFLDKLKPSSSFTQIYGLTEASPLVTIEAEGSTDHRSSGYPLPNTDLKIVDTNSQTLGPNEIGEVYIRGPQVMKGYRDNIEATKNIITDDGWLKSGDLGYISENGALYIMDRLKELIKVKGYQVPPAELESVLKEHPAIEDAAVIGVPNEKYGEVPKAFVVLKQGFPIEDKEILDFVKERVTDYKWINDVTFIDSVPRNPSGKILRRIIKEKYC